MMPIIIEQTTNPVTIIIAMIIRTEIRISTKGLDSLLCGDTTLTVNVSDKDIFTKAIRFFDFMMVEGNEVFNILILVVDVRVIIRAVFDVISLAVPLSSYCELETTLYEVSEA